MRHRCRFLLSTSALLVVPWLSACDPFVNVRGRVVMMSNDSADSTSFFVAAGGDYPVTSAAPISNAEVSAEFLDGNLPSWSLGKVSSRSDGTFSFHSLGTVGKTVRIRAQAPGYRDIDVQVPIGRDATFEVTLVLEITPVPQPTSNATGHAGFPVR